MKYRIKIESELFTETTSTRYNWEDVYTQVIELRPEDIPELITYINKKKEAPGSFVKIGSTE